MPLSREGTDIDYIRSFSWTQEALKLKASCSRIGDTVYYTNYKRRLFRDEN